MLAVKNHLVIIVLTLWTALCNAQFRVFRGDSRSPDEIRAAGGFRARGVSALAVVAPNISMYNHALGENGQSRDNDGYVSTTAERTVAIQFIRARPGGNGYVYEIAATPSFIQVSGTLGEFSPYANEAEYAAMGGFNLDQVIGWTRFEGGIAVGGFVANSNYAANTYNPARPSNGAPILAGFPPGHAAWRRAPWIHFANCNPDAKAKRQAGGCNPRETAQQAAQNWLRLCIRDNIIC